MPIGIRRSDFRGRLAAGFEAFAWPRSVLPLSAIKADAVPEGD